MTAESICRKATNFGFTLLENEFAIDARVHQVHTHSASKKSVRWTRTRQGSLMIDNPARLDDYIRLVKDLEYSYLMADGGVIQIAYIMSGGRIEGHRLLFFPCPFPIGPSDISPFSGGGILDAINDRFMNDPAENILLNSPVRFDYTMEEAAEYHPSSHVTINSPHCRIPARSAL